jgi:hypothetical protein
MVWQIGVLPPQPVLSVQILQLLVEGSQTGVVPEQVTVQPEPASSTEPPPPPLPPPAMIGSAHLPVRGSQVSPVPQRTPSQGSFDMGPH